MRECCRGTDVVSLQAAVNMSLVNTAQQQYQLHKKPSMAIVEEPTPRVRFRYATEGDNAGNIYGVNSTGLRQTFPTLVVSFTLRVITHRCSNFNFVTGTL